MKNKYRVKVIVTGYSGITEKYIIQVRILGIWWNYSNSSDDKNIAYQTCEDLNTPYDEMRKKYKKV